MVAVYEDGKKASGQRSLSDASAASRDPRAVVWISLVEPSREELDSLARQFELQELAQEDTETRKGVILKFQGRGLTFMVSPARYLDDSGTVEIGELDVHLEEGLAITVLRGEGPNFHDVEQSLEEGSYLSRLGSGAILQGAGEVFSYKLSANTEVRLLEERHAQELTDLTDRNREHLRAWLPWVDTNRTVEDLKNFIRCCSLALRYSYWSC